ncbi:mitochondrial import inner membrane translocase subunit tim54 [Agyrium rufum]|nr:mitochondrial import inner membrane translocase subunit tim54 [Agyrium rufum]
MAEPAKPVNPPPKPSWVEGNPVFMGLPRLRAKLPSRNWLIFLTVSGSFISAVTYDRYQKKRAIRKWCDVVSPLAQETLPTKQLPRKITVFLAAPPGDSIRTSREFFVQYVKPVLVAAAIDWDVVEGRREGELRVGLAEKIRKLRIEKGEVAPPLGEGADKQQLERRKELDEEMLTRSMIVQMRKANEVEEWKGLRGDLVIGRHAWKEYIRGLHEGWLGPLIPPTPPSVLETSSTPSEIQNTADTSSSNSDTTQTGDTPDPSDQVKAAEPPKPEEKEKKKAKKMPQPPYILPELYAINNPPTSISNSLPPTLPLSFPNILGFFNTPIRTYRYLTQRRLADRIGRDTAALVLATSTRAFELDSEFVSSSDFSSNGADLNSPTAQSSEDSRPHVVRTAAKWEQYSILEQEEQYWHKIARRPNPPEEKDKERPWMEDMVVDDRVGQRMSLFVIDEEAERKAKDAEARQRDWRWIDWGADIWSRTKKSVFGEESIKGRGAKDGEVGEDF